MPLRWLSGSRCESGARPGCFGRTVSRRATNPRVSHGGRLCLRIITGDPATSTDFVSVQRYGGELWVTCELWAIGELWTTYELWGTCAAARGECAGRRCRAGRGARAPLTRCSYAACHTGQGAFCGRQRVEHSGQLPLRSASCAVSSVRHPSVRRGSSERATDSREVASARWANSLSTSSRSHTASRSTWPRISSTCVTVAFADSRPVLKSPLWKFPVLRHRLPTYRDRCGRRYGTSTEPMRGRVLTRRTTGLRGGGNPAALRRRPWV